MYEDTILRIEERKIIAIVRGVAGEDILRLSEALHEGGVSLIEVTFQQAKPETWEETAAAIAAINERFGVEVLAGAGTVLTQEQLCMAVDAGAKYIISPHTDINLIRETKKKGLVSIPGAMTPSEIVAAHSAGADFVKLFPAAQLGCDYIKAIRAPISHVKLMAVGGVNENNIKSFLDAGVVGAGVGGNLVNKKLIAAGEFDKLTALAKEYVKNIQ